MPGIVLLLVFGFILIVLTGMTYHLRAIIRNLDTGEGAEEELESKKEGIAASLNYVYTAMILVSAGLAASLYIYVRDTPREAHLMEWLNMALRLMHITFGIAWIGASFYFVFLENALNRTKDIRDELAGNLWAVHGGGFYYLEKYKVAPKTIPRHLHWFKYEAYFTWLTGFCLLFIVYYFNASALLIDKNILDITPPAAIGIGTGSFIVAWVIYNLLCRSPLIKKPVLFILIGFAVLVGFAYFYSHVFSGRAAYIHFGAMIGSIMVANVFFIIIPSQKAMVRAAKKGLPLDPQPGKNALNRSLHNNYFTLPVLFVMISNHFPTTFGYDQPWLILIIISLGTAGVKHYLNLREKNQLSVWVLPVSVVILLAGAFISAPAKDPGACNSKIEFSEVNAIIQARCISCHSSRPTDDIYKAPPNGVMYDTPDDIVRKKDLIMLRVVITKTMPQNNKTNITQKERDIIRCWIEQGAAVK